MVIGFLRKDSGRVSDRGGFRKKVIQASVRALGKQYGFNREVARFHSENFETPQYSVRNLLRLRVWGLGSVLLAIRALAVNFQNASRPKLKRSETEANS